MDQGWFGYQEGTLPFSSHPLNLVISPSIDHNPRRGEKIKIPHPEKGKYKARSSSERVNSYLKDAFGRREQRVRWAKQAMMSLSLGFLAIASQQLMKL
ncbi:MAG: hypothetical protein AB8C84_12900 [Oligoflexales bacterium]